MVLRGKPLANRSSEENTQSADTGLPEIQIRRQSVLLIIQMLKLGVTVQRDWTL